MRHSDQSKRKTFAGRSLDRPDQLDGLGGIDQIKVEKANQLYDAVQRIAACAISLDICVAIENPGNSHNSHYWNTTPMMKLKEEFGNDLVNFHSCAHGGTRDQLTTIWQSKPWFTSLGLKCSKHHRRASWQPKQVGGKKGFPTAQEAAYPHLLCERIIDCTAEQLMKEQFAPLTCSNRCRLRPRLSRDNCYGCFTKRKQIETVGCSICYLSHRLS